MANTMGLGKAQVSNFTMTLANWAADYYRAAKSSQPKTNIARAELIESVLVLLYKEMGNHGEKNVEDKLALEILAKCKEMARK